MKFCEIITSFNPNDFEILRKNIILKETIFFTDNLVIREKIRQLGYEIEEIREYFGYVNPTLYSILNEAIKKTELIKNNTIGIKYEKVDIIDGLKNYFIDRLTFLEKIKSILNEKKNIIFLFSGISYFHFAIPIIALQLGYENRFGVSTVSNSSLNKLDFKEIFAKNYPLLKNQSAKIRGLLSHGLDFELELSKNINYQNVKTAFFLTNNEEDLYLKPVYPILDKFEETKTSHIIFTFSPRSSKGLMEKGYKAVDLSTQIDNLEIKILQKNQKLVSNFFNKIKESFTDDYVLNSYLMYVQNDRIVKDLVRILSGISVVKKVLEKVKPKSIFVEPDGTSENDLVCSISKICHIPTFSIPIGDTEYSPIFRVMYNAENLLLSGPRLKHEMLSLGVDEKRLLVTGYPRYSYINQNLQGLNSESRTKGKMIIVAMSRMHTGDEKWMSELIRFCNINNIEIIIKVHPLYKFLLDKREIWEEKVRTIEKNCLGLKYTISYDIDLRDLFSNASILITEYSTFGVEAALHGIPIIVANMSNEIFYDYSLAYHKEKIALYATNISELLECINKIINNHDNINESLLDARKKFNYEFNYLNDGKEAERVFNILTR